MHFVLDPWFLVRLLEGEAEAKQWLREQVRQHILFVPTICLVELVRVALDHGKSWRQMSEFLDGIYQLDRTLNFKLVGMHHRAHVVEAAGKLGHQHKVGVADCIVLATAQSLRAAIPTAPKSDVARIAKK